MALSAPTTTKREILIRIAANTARPGVCKGCGKAIIWMDTLNGKQMPMNRHAMARHVDDGVEVYDASDAHWASCPARAKFDKGQR